MKCDQLKISLKPETLQTLAVLAEKKGLSLSSMGRSLIIERLNEITPLCDPSKVKHEGVNTITQIKVGGVDE